MQLGYVLILSGAIMIASTVIYHIIAGLFGFSRQIAVGVGHSGVPVGYCHICQQVSNAFILIAIIGFFVIISGIVYFVAKRKSQKLNKVILIVGVGMTVIGAGVFLSISLIITQYLNQPVLNMDFLGVLSIIGIFIFFIGIFTLGVRGLISLFNFVQNLRVEQ